MLGMKNFASALIDALGGTTDVAKFMNAAVSTVHNMRTRRLTASRLNHLRRIARDEMPLLDVEALALDYGFDLGPIGSDTEASSGNDSEITARDDPPPFPAPLQRTDDPAPRTATTSESSKGVIPSGREAISTACPTPTCSPSSKSSLANCASGTATNDGASNDLTANERVPA